MIEPSFFDRRFTAAVVAISCLGFLLRILWLPSQPPSVDDFSVAITAINYMEAGQLGPTMWNHPGLRNILIYWSMQLFGSGLIGVKGWSLLFGTLSVPLLAVVGRQITGMPAVGVLAAFLWAIEPLTIDFSRQGINDIYLAFFPLLAIWCALRYDDTRNPWWLLGSGCAFGLGLASKWGAVFQLAATGCLLLYTMLRSRRESWPLVVSRMIYMLCTLIVLPFTIYLLTFLPWFGRGYSLREWPALQVAMYRETKLHTGYHKVQHGDRAARDWFVKPVKYRELFPFQKEGAPPREASIEEMVVLLIAFANPLVWLIVLPAWAFTAFHGVRSRNPRLLFLAGIFAISYVPFAVAPRPVWVNTALVVLPYAFLCVAYALWSISSGSKSGRRLLAGYVMVVILLNAVFYFPAIGKGFQVPFFGDYLIEKYVRGHNGGS